MPCHGLVERKCHRKEVGDGSHDNCARENIERKGSVELTYIHCQSERLTVFTELPQCSSTCVMVESYAVRIPW